MTTPEEGVDSTPPTRGIGVCNWREQLPTIEKGQSYWKCRKMEIAIMECMERATVPNTRYQVSNKVRKNITCAQPYDVGYRMAKLAADGLLRAVGYDDGDILYVLEVNYDLH